jgi:hypothetical protein
VNGVQSILCYKSGKGIQGRENEKVTAVLEEERRRQSNWWHGKCRARAIVESFEMALLMLVCLM